MPEAEVAVNSPPPVMSTTSTFPLGSETVPHKQNPVLNSTFDALLFASWKFFPPKKIHRKVSKGIVSGSCVKSSTVYIFRNVALLFFFLSFLILFLFILVILRRDLTFHNPLCNAQLDF